MGVQSRSQGFLSVDQLCRVRGYLIKNRDFELAAEVATLIAQIACTDEGLPQGSPCSPVFANLIAHHLDMRLVALAAKNGCIYSRYADDITFSSNKKVFSAEIAVMESVAEQGAVHRWRPSDQLREIITRSGFAINDKKTSMMYGSSRQQVTGLVVNRKVNTTAEYRRTVRAMVHRLVTTGTFDVLGAVNKNGVMELEKRPGTLDELHGMLGFVDSIQVSNLPKDQKKKSATSKDKSGSKPSKERWTTKPTAGESSYRRFLFSKLFYLAKLPVIICEGDTDNVYLTHAIRSLAFEYPDLARVEGDR